MKLSNYGKAEKNPVIPNLSITPDRFAKMSFDAQQSLINRNSHIGSQGSTHPEWIVPPQCTRGVTTGELMDCMDYLDKEMQKAGEKKSRRIRRDKEAAEIAQKFNDNKDVKV